MTLPFQLFLRISPSSVLKGLTEELKFHGGVVANVTVSGMVYTLVVGNLVMH